MHMAPDNGSHKCPKVNIIRKLNKDLAACPVQHIAKFIKSLRRQQMCGIHALAPLIIRPAQQLFKDGIGTLKLNMPILPYDKCHRPKHLVNLALMGYMLFFQP